MSQSKTRLLTPIYIKPRADTAWPKDSVFYMLTGSGLFLCRDNQFYQSAVPAPRWPTELAKQEAFLAIRYPKISRRLLECVVGYFERVADTHNTEAAVLLAWNKVRERVQVVVPDQVATITRNGWGAAYPVGVEYEIPANLSPDLAIIGDIHSHVDSAAFSSYVDKHDETHRPGLHVVVGRIHQEPPQFHIEAVTDGVRFTVDPELVLDGYERRCTDVPDAWMDKITVETYGKRYYKNYDDHSYGTRAVNKNDGYGDYDYDKRLADTAAGGPDGNGQTCKKKWGYETGHDPADEELVEETIGGEILDKLDVAAPLPEEENDLKEENADERN